MTNIHELSVITVRLNQLIFGKQNLFQVSPVASPESSAHTVADPTCVIFTYPCAAVSAAAAATAIKRKDDCGGGRRRQIDRFRRRQRRISETIEKEREREREWKSLIHEMRFASRKLKAH